MERARALELPLALRLASGAGLAVWVLVAAFPLFWIAAMSFKLPLDAFSANALQVVIGPATRAAVGGVSVIGIVAGSCAAGSFWWMGRRLGLVAAGLAWAGRDWTGWLFAASGFVVAVAAIVASLPAMVDALEGVARTVPGVRVLAEPVLGLTMQNYRTVWIDRGFYRQFLNSMLVTAGVVTVSLTVGTLAGYGLARTRTRLAFWLLVVALVFRAMPHSVLVAGYLPAFINSRETLAPLWSNAVTGPVLRLFSAEAPTLYGQPFAVIAVLVAINQPFTIWMLRSFFANIPSELDEAARVDGCSHFEAFRRVIIPVMWPGVITTGLFSFLLAYNDYLVTALLLDAQSLTMVPAISQFLNSETTANDQLLAIAAAVSITAPLFLLVMVFQRHIVGGLTQGAVKG